MIEPLKNMVTWHVPIGASNNVTNKLQNVDLCDKMCTIIMNWL